MSGYVGSNTGAREPARSSTGGGGFLIIVLRFWSDVPQFESSC
jgi:hypothetical protein